MVYCTTFGARSDRMNEYGVKEGVSECVSLLSPTARS